MSLFNDHFVKMFAKLCACLDRGILQSVSYIIFWEYISLASGEIVGIDFADICGIVFLEKGCMFGKVILNGGCSCFVWSHMKKYGA